MVVGSEAAGPGSTAAAEGAQRSGSGGGDDVGGDESDVMAALRVMRRRAAALKSARDKLLGQVQRCYLLAAVTASSVDMRAFACICDGRSFALWLVQSCVT